MGNSSTKAKNKYNAKSYDRIGLVLPKGEKEIFQEFAKAQGLSLNALVTSALKNEVRRRTAYKRRTFSRKRYK